MNWSSGDRPLKWKHQQSQTDFALNFLKAGQPVTQKGCILALSADEPQKYFEMFSDVASSYHFAEQNPVVYRRLFNKVRNRIGKDVMTYPTTFFRVPYLLHGNQRIKVIDFDTCTCYHDDYAWEFRKLFRSRKLSNRSTIRWTFCPRMGMEYVEAGIAKIVRHAIEFGYQVQQLPNFSYAEYENNVRVGTVMVTGQMHLEKR
jgi:hypothetical protein